MRVLACAAMVLLLSVGPAFAQRGGGFRGGGSRGGFHRGFGGARIHAPARGFQGGFHRGGNFRLHVGSSFARNRLFFGHGNRFFFNKGFGFHRGFGFGFGGYFVPYSYVLPAYPAYVGSTYIDDYSMGYPAAAVTPPAYAAPQSPVVVNQQFTSPVIRDSSPLVYEPLVRRAEPPPQAPAQAPENRSAVIYLIALTSNVIRPALAYWVENGTLHYVGLNRKQTSVSLAEVNRDLSVQLNRERGVPFRLPDAP